MRANGASLVGRPGRQTTTERGIGSLAREERGLALIAALMTVTLIGGIIAAALITARNVTRTTNASYHDSRVMYAAEAGAEAALSAIEMAVADGVITPTELAAMTAPPIQGFEFTEYSVVKDGEIVIETITDGPFAGLYSLTQNLMITSVVTDRSGALGGVILDGKAQAIPIFQFGWFREGANQAGAGARWDAWGRVHSNGGLYLINCDGHFHDMLTTPASVHRDGFSLHRPIGGGVNMCAIKNYIDNASGVESELLFDSYDTPDPEQFKARSAADFDSRLQTSAFGVDSLKLPLPDGVSPRELITPKEVDDSPSEKAVKFSWLADFYVTIDLGNLVNKNAACDNSPPAGAPAFLPSITVTRANGPTAVPSDAIKCKIFRFRWESFFDNHEEGWVDVLDLDMAELRDWIENGPGDETEILYVEFVNVDATPLDPGVTDLHSNGFFDAKFYPVMKIINGSQLPGPLTLGSEYTVYVQGDYNTINWQPSAVFGDLIGTLSNAWDDSNAQVDWDPTSWWCRFQMPDCPPASHTEQNYAFVTSSANGAIDCFHEDPTCTPPPYKPLGGGKMLESWRNSTNCGDRPQNRCLHQWKGSQVTLWVPETTSVWFDFPGWQYYYPPDRDHRFDTRFLDPDSLPPATPVVGQVFRAAFRPIY